MLADRDGSNQRRLFPPDGQPGLSPQQLAWSPAARHLAFIYREQLWLLAISNGESRRLTFTGMASAPDWAG